MKNVAPAIYKQISSDDVYKSMTENYQEIGPIWANHQMEWCNTVYSAFKDHEKFLIIIYLVSKTLDFYSKNLYQESFDDFYSNDTVEIEKFNVIEISKNLNIPKESARRKVIELEKNGVIKRIKKKVIVDRSAFPFVRPNNSIKRVARFLSIFSNHLEKNKVINNKYRSEEIEEIIKSRFTVTWKLWYDMQIPLLVSWKKFFDDLETWHIWGVCVVNQGFEQSKKAKIKMNRLQYFKSISDPDKNFRGLNAMTLSEISGIPRATVVRKLKNLLKFKYLKKDLKKHYILTDITDDEMHTINKTMLRSLAIFSTKIFNLSLNKS